MRSDERAPVIARARDILGAQHAAPHLGQMSAVRFLGAIILAADPVIPTGASRFSPPLRSCGASARAGRNLS
jgi:hypothetical protein